MQRTAAQKLAAERLVLGRGIFDMGSSMKDGDGDGMTVAGKLGCKPVSESAMYTHPLSSL